MLCRAVALLVLWTLPLVGQKYNVYTVAGGGVPHDVLAASAATSRVTGMAADATGNVYMSLFDYAAVVKLDTDGILTLVAGTGIPGFSGDGSPATEAQLNEPLGIALDSSGALYIADNMNGRIRKVSNGVITTVAGNGTTSFFSFLSRICGVILVPGVVPSCDKAQFP